MNTYGPDGLCPLPLVDLDSSKKKYISVTTVVSIHRLVSFRK